MTIILNIPVHCMNIRHCDWFSKEAEWPVSGQDKVRRESQRALERRTESGELRADAERNQMDMPY